MTCYMTSLSAGETHFHGFFPKVDDDTIDTFCFLSRNKFFIMKTNMKKTDSMPQKTVSHSNKSQRTSKCGKNISDTLGCARSHFFVLNTF